MPCETWRTAWDLLGKAGKAGKTLGKILTWVDKIMNDVFNVAAKQAGKAINKVLAPLKAIAEKIRAGTGAVKTLITDILNKLKEWLESFVGKIGEAGIKVIDNAVMTVERITKKVNDKITEYYLVTYHKRAGAKLLCTIIPIEPFIKLFEKAITYNTRQNLRKLAQEGFELMEKDGLYYFKYGDEIIDLGNAENTAQQINALFDKSTGDKARKALNELIELIKKRRTIYEKWVGKFDESFINHLSGDVEIIPIKIKDVWKSSEQWLYRGIQGQGGHWLNEFIIVRKIIPPPAVSRVADIPLDTPFKAKIDIKSLRGKLFPKLEDSSMFPRNWSKERIQEEVAWVYENTVEKSNGFVRTKVVDGKNIHQYLEKSTTGFDILIEIDDAKNILNAYPYL